MLTLFLPWYSAVFRGENESFNRSAFGEFSFVEAAVLLVAVAVLYLVWARSQRKAFHLPGGDGTVIMGAGAWAFLLIVWRLFDTPEADNAEFGLQWGIFVALAAAGLLTAAGARVRAAHRPEPPNPVSGGQRLGAPAARRAVARAAAARDDRRRRAARAARLGGRAARGAGPRRAPGRRGRARRWPPATSRRASVTRRPAAPIGRTGCSRTRGAGTKFNSGIEGVRPGSGAGLAGQRRSLRDPRQSAGVDDVCRRERRSTPAVTGPPGVEAIRRQR